jgi:hypothetical protein
MPGIGELVRKDLLARNLSTLRHFLSPRLKTDELAFVPPTYCFPEERACLAEAIERGVTNRWICKPAASAGARGVEIVDDPLVFLSASSGGHWVCQPYIEDPLLLHGHKFIVKAYLLLRRLEPLEAYLHSEPRVLLAPEPYRRGDWDDRARHITNPGATPGHYGEHWAWEELAAALQAEGIDAERAWADVRRIATWVLFATRGKMLAQQRSVGWPSERSYEVLAVDVLFDARGKIWLLEGNYNPSHGPGHRSAMSNVALRSAGWADAFCADLLAQLGLVSSPGRTAAFEPLLPPWDDWADPLPVAADVVTHAVGNELLLARAEHPLALLDSTSSVVWQGVAWGLRSTEIAAALAARFPEVGNEQILADTRTAIAAWRWSGWLVDRQPAPPDRFDMRFAGVPLRLQLQVPGALAWLELALARYRLEGADQPARTLTLEPAGEALAWRTARRSIPCAALDGALPILRALLIRGALSAEPRAHAATVALSGDEVLLLVGVSGSGKSTLAAYLHVDPATNGCLGDEAVRLSLVGGKLHASAVPAPIALEAGAWPWLAERLPSLLQQPIHRRHDRERVRYLAPVSAEEVAPRQVRAIVWLEFMADAITRLEPLEPAAALRSLFGSVITLESRSSAPAPLLVWVAALAATPSYHLRHGSLHDARTALAPLLESSGPSGLAGPGSG